MDGQTQWSPKEEELIEQARRRALSILEAAGKMPFAELVLRLEDENPAFKKELQNEQGTTTIASIAVVRCLRYRYASLTLGRKLRFLRHITTREIGIDQ